MTRMCPACGSRYSYEVPTCTMCGADLAAVEPARATALAVTEVVTPSTGHEDVPYWCALVRSDDGSMRIVKSDQPIGVGDSVSLATTTAADLASVGIVGSGVMGQGLAALFLVRGHEVAWYGRNAERLDAAAARVFVMLEKVMDDTELASARQRLRAHDTLDVLGRSDVVIEAAAEDLGVKLALLQDVERAIRRDAVLATNTSGLSLDDLATALERPERFGSLHFFNPPMRMRLVETAVGERTSPEVSAFLDEFAVSLGKVPVRVAAKPAFVVNRVLMPLLNEAVRVLEEGVASAESIDEAIRLGLNHPMGPLALADLIGLDVVCDIMGNLSERTGDATYEPRPMLRRLVADGHLGRKTGRGFYEYPARA